MFDLSKVNVQGEIDEGDYVARVLEAEIKDSKSGGQYLKLKYVLEENNQHVYDNFSTVHTNPRAVQVGLGRLKSLLKASAYPNPDMLKDIRDLNGLRFKAHVKNKTDEFGTKAVVTSYKPIKADEAPAKADNVPF